LKTLASVLGLTTVCLALAASTALAGRPSDGATATTAGASVSASPNPAAAWGTRVYISGCGFATGPAEVHVVHSAGYTQTFMVAMWSTGCLDTAYFTTSEPGTYRIEVYQTSGTKRRATTSLKATTTLTVS
jgi:hypothetical protein